MMEVKLSIVIVNYNVRYFILKCLESIYKADKINLDVEVIVVDNASVDGSNSAIEENFPNTILIKNRSNVGFAKANNQGFKIASGEYVLALNPDTILQEDTLVKTIEYMQFNENCGACGVKMIDGSGNYLPESKRGLPTLWNSICKFSGLTNLFPNSKIFSGYYMGHLNEDNNHKVDVLCGAFMMFKKEILSKFGGFDEDYFMYGEDIDLSQKIKSSGYDVAYIANTRIIHFKGESSKKASFNYIKNFYNAMLIYVGKHYGGLYGSLMKMLIYIAIYLSAVLSFIKNNVISHFDVLIDAILIFFGTTFLRGLWGHYYFGDENYFNNQASYINTISFTVIMTFCLWFFGHYDSNWKFRRTLFGSFTAVTFSLLIYALLPTNLRSSRALIIIGALTSLSIVYVTKNLNRWVKRILKKEKSSNYLIVASKDNGQKISDIISKSDRDSVILGTVYPFQKENVDSFYLNTIDNLSSVIKTIKPEHVVFSNADLSLQTILDLMIYPDKEVKYLITGGDENSVIGSGSKNKNGSLLIAESNYKLSQSVYLRVKKLFDICSSLILLIFSPILIFFKTFRSQFLNSLFSVLVGRKTWVGYINDKTSLDLPKLKDQVFTTQDLIGSIEYYPPIKNSEMANNYYARMYSVFLDAKILLKKLFNDDSNR